MRQEKIVFGLFVLLIALSGCSYQAIEKGLREAYPNGVTSFKFSDTYTTYSDTFRVCDSNNAPDGCKPQGYADFDNLEETDSFTMVLTIKSPDKFIRVDYPSRDAQPSQFMMCSGTTLYSWDAKQTPAVIIAMEHTPSCDDVVASFLEIYSPAFLVQRIKKLNLQMRITGLDGKDVIELHSKTGFLKNRQEELLAYLDAKTYSPLIATETMKEIFDLVIEGKEITHITLEKKVTDNNFFEVNTVSDEEFAIPEELKDIPVCSFTIEEATAAYDRFVAEAPYKEFFAKEEFEKYEDLRVSQPSNKCLNEKPRNYQDYRDSIISGCGDPETRQFTYAYDCYLNMALSFDDASICDKITEEEFRQSCREAVAAE